MHRRRTRGALHLAVAANIRAEAARRGWTQQQLADRIGLGRISMSDRYRGRTAWSLDEVEQVADAMGLQVADLLARPEGIEPPTFWLGADHTLTVERTAQSPKGPATVVFCDVCGWRSMMASAALERGAHRHGHSHGMLVQDDTGAEPRVAQLLAERFA